jgi:hypothetical protein
VLITETVGGLPRHEFPMLLVAHADRSSQSV